MHLRTRYFLVDDDDQIQRLSAKKYERLIRGGSGLFSSHFAGKQVREASALVYYDDDAVPIEVLHGHFGYLYFDAEGYLDYGRYEHDRHLVMGAALEAVDSGDAEPVAKVIKARAKLDSRRTDHECRWKPTRELETAIYEVALGELRGIPWVKLDQATAATDPPSWDTTP